MKYKSNINSMGNKFEKRSIVVSGNIDIFMISEINTDESFLMA